MRVTVCTDQLELVRFVFPFRNTDDATLHELVEAGLANLPRKPPPLGERNG